MNRRKFLLSSAAVIAIPATNAGGLTPLLGDIPGRGITLSGKAMTASDLKFMLNEISTELRRKKSMVDIELV